MADELQSSKRVRVSPQVAAMRAAAIHNVAVDIPRLFAGDRDCFSSRPVASGHIVAVRNDFTNKMLAAKYLEESIRYCQQDCSEDVRGQRLQRLATEVGSFANYVEPQFRGDAIRSSGAITNACKAGNADDAIGAALRFLRIISPPPVSYPG
jgi:hypothetical protein